MTFKYKTSLYCNSSTESMLSLLLQKYESTLLGPISCSNTWRRKTILRASCISFSSCSWWASSCSTQDFSSFCPSCPRDGHRPQSSGPSETDTGTRDFSKWRRWSNYEDCICSRLPMYLLINFNSEDWAVWEKNCAKKQQHKYYDCD